MPASQKNGSVAEGQNGRDMEDWKPLFHIVRSHFQGLDVPITEVMYLECTVFIVLKHRNTDYTKLPFRVANILCYYMFEDDMGRSPAPHGLRLLDPLGAPGDPNLRQYDAPQPGLRVASSPRPISPDFVATAAGVLVGDVVGNEFMTVVAHGFPGECGTQVFHASPNTGLEIGEVAKQAALAEIALAKLRDTEAFSNVTFHSHRKPIHPRKLVAVKNHHRRNAFCLASLDTGFVEAQLMLPSSQAIPLTDNSAEQDWASTTWSYLGQDSAGDVPTGMCGADNGSVRSMLNVIKDLKLAGDATVAA